jgi:hypothetical protein
VELEQAVLCPDVGRWVNAARLHSGKTASARARTELWELQPRDGLKEKFVYLFTSSKVSNAGIVITIFT